MNPVIYYCINVSYKYESDCVSMQTANVVFGQLLTYFSLVTYLGILWESEIHSLFIKRSKFYFIYDRLLDLFWFQSPNLTDLLYNFPMVRYFIDVLIVDKWKTKPIDQKLPINIYWCFAFITNHCLLLNHCLSEQTLLYLDLWFISIEFNFCVDGWSTFSILIWFFKIWLMEISNRL